MKAVVLEDPSHVHPIGLVVEGVNNVRHALHARRALLPFVSDNPTLSNSGWVMRHYGHGWNFQANKGERGCPLTLRLTANGGKFIYWAAKVGVQGAGLAQNTTMRMVHSAERDQRGLAVGLNQIVHMDKVPPIDKQTGTAVVYGKSSLHEAVDMLVFLELYTVASNLSVLWFGVSQFNEDVAWPLR